MVFSMSWCLVCPCLLHNFARRWVFVVCTSPAELRTLVSLTVLWKSVYIMQCVSTSSSTVQVGVSYCIVEECLYHAMCVDLFQYCVYIMQCVSTSSSTVQVGVSDCIVEECLYHAMCVDLFQYWASRCL